MPTPGFTSRGANSIDPAAIGTARLPEASFDSGAVMEGKGIADRLREAVDAAGQDAKAAKEPSALDKVIGAAVVLGLVCWWMGYTPFGGGSSTGPTSGSSRATASVARSASRPLPEDEKLFLQVLDRGSKAYDAGSNEMQKGASRPKRAKELCSSLAGYGVSGWRGTLSQLSSNSEGKGVVAIDLGNGVSVKTWNNELSDVSSRTLLDPGSDLYDRVSALAVGTGVVFTGTLFPSRTDCFEETSLTQDGSMTEPEFLMRFVDIRPDGP